MAARAPRLDVSQPEVDDDDNNDDDDDNGEISSDLYRA